MHLICPHCYNPIELIEAVTTEEILCPACGSSVRMAHGSTTRWNPSDGARKCGKFELMQEVGCGAFGTVYMARDPELDRVVAVKVPRGGNLAGEQDLTRFLREARSVAQLRHPSIVSVHEVGVHEGVPFLVSDFVHGQTLADILSARRPSPNDAVRLIAILADALQFAHERGVVHRDVKPSNVMLGEDGAPFLMDFGLAKREAGEITMTIDGQVLGTPAYMSPEQARGESHAVDGRSDVYSLGVMLYQMLTGELPFRGTTRMLLHQVLHDDPRPLRKLNDRIPRDLETICLKAMAKEPGRRYARAADLAADLRHFQKGEPIVARPIGALERSVKWVKRRPAVAGLLAALVVVTVAGFAGIGWKYLEAEQQRREAEKQTGLANQRKEDTEKALLAAEQSERTAKEKAESESKARVRETVAKEHAIAEERERRKQLQRAEVAVLANHLALAQRETELHNLERARELLDQCPWDLRGWEWLHLRGYQRERLSFAEPRSGSGGTTALTCIAWSPDGRRLATGGTDTCVRVWDATTGKALLVCQGASPSATAVAFSSDGKWLAASHGRGVIVWEANTGVQRLFFARQLKGPTLTSSVGIAFSLDSRRLAAVATDGTLDVWDVPSGAKVLSHSDPSKVLQCVAFSPDGLHLAIGNDKREVQLCHVATGRPIHTLVGHTNSVRSVAFSPDGQRVASGSGYPTGARDGSVGGELIVWDALAARELYRLPIQRFGLDCVQFSPDGLFLACLNHQKAVQVLDAPTGKERAILWQNRTEDWNDPPSCIAFSPDGRQLAGAGAHGAILVFDARLDRETVVVAARYPPIDMAFSPDGQLLALAGGGRIGGGEATLWDTRTGRQLRSLRNQSGLVSAVAFRPDGQWLATSGRDGIVRLWEVATGKELFSFKVPQVTCLAFSADGKRLATGSEDKTVKVWDLQTRRERFTLGSVWARQIAFSSDDERLYVATVGQLWRVWDAKTGRQLLFLPAPLGDAQSLAVSPDGKCVAVGHFSGTVVMRDALTGAELMQLEGHRGPVTKVSFSPDGRRLASGSGTHARRLNLGNTSDEVKIWDSETGQELLTFTGEGERPDGMCFSTDGRRLAAGWSDGTTRLWEIANDPELLRLQRRLYLGGSFNSEAIAFSPDGQLLAIGGLGDFDRQLAVYETKTGRKACTLHQNEPIHGVAFSPDGQRLATRSGIGNMVRLWDSHTGKELLTLRGGKPEGIGAIWFSADGCQIYARAAQGTIWSWNTTTGAEAPVGPELPPPPRGSKIYSPDGQLVVLVEPRFLRVIRTRDQGREADNRRQQQDDETTVRWHWRFAEEQLKADNRFAARFHLDRIVELRPGDPEPLVLRAQLSERERNANLALRDYDAALERLPKSTDLWLRRALAELRRGRSAAALADLERADKLAPDDGALALARFWILRKSGQHAEARTAWVRAAELSPALRLTPDEGVQFSYIHVEKVGATASMWELWQILAPEVFAEAEEEKAFLLAARIGLLAQPVPSSLVPLGVLPRDSSLQLASPRGGINADLCRALAVLHLGLGNAFQSNEEFNHASRLDPTDRVARRSMLLLSAQQGQMDRVVRESGIGPDGRPDTWELWYLRGKSMTRHPGKEQDAIDSLSQAIAAGGDGVAVRRERAEMYARLRQWDKAVADYSAILDKRSDDTSALMARARILAVRGDWPRAAAEYAQMVEKYPELGVDIGLEHACLRLLVDDKEGYERACAVLVERYERKQDAFPGQCLQAVVLGPLTATSPNGKNELADRVRKMIRESNSDITWTTGSFQLADTPAAFDRLAQLEKIHTVQKSNRLKVVVMQRALILQRQGKTVEARRDFEKAVDWLDKQGKEMPAEAATTSNPLTLVNWLAMHILRQQIEASFKKEKLADKP